MNTRSCLVIAVFLLLFFALISGIMGDMDLTPDTPPAAPGEISAASGPALNRAVVSGGNAGPCGSVYTIQPGDSLFAIAARCGVTMDDLLAANTRIGNPDQITAGEQLAIPGARAVVDSPRPAQPTEPHAFDVSTQAPDPTQAPNAPVVMPTLTPVKQAVLLGKDGAAQIEGAQPGSPLVVTVRDLPPGALVVIQVGPAGGPYVDLQQVQSNDMGQVRAEVVLPADLPAGSEATIAVVVIAESPFAVTSVPFKIVP